MLGLNNDNDTLRRKNLIDGIGDLRGEALLNLGTTSIALDNARKL